MAEVPSYLPEEMLSLSLQDVEADVQRVVDSIEPEGRQYLEIALGRAAIREKILLTQVNVFTVRDPYKIMEARICQLYPGLAKVLEAQTNAVWFRLFWNRWVMVFII